MKLTHAQQHLFAVVLAAGATAIVQMAIVAVNMIAQGQITLPSRGLGVFMAAEAPTMLTFLAFVLSALHVYLPAEQSPTAAPPNNLGQSYTYVPPGPPER